MYLMPLSYTLTMTKRQVLCYVYLPQQKNLHSKAEITCNFLKALRKKKDLCSKGLIQWAGVAQTPQR